MNKLVLILASTILLASCSKKKPTVYENDTDSHDWINQKTVKDVPQAHSGSSASVMDSISIYSLGFSRTIESISSNKFKTVEFSYWAFIKSDKTKLNTVFSIDFNQQNIDWEGREVPIKELNKWIEIREVYKLSPKAQSNNKISIYVLNQSKEEVLIDDLKVEFK